MLETQRWTPDRTDTDVEDPDSLTNTPRPPKDPKPDVPADAGRGKGKTSASTSQKPTEGDEDCQIVEVYDILPLSYAYPVSPTSADTSGQVVQPSRGTKRTSETQEKTKKKPPKKLKQTQLTIPPRPRARQGVIG